MFKVYIKNMDLTTYCNEYETVLDALERAGLAGRMYGCRGGGCGVCKFKLLDGEVEVSSMSRAHISVEDQANGLLLACCIKPKSSLSIELFGDHL